ncbi:MULTISPECIES: pentapeptide repeat-containing protein [unclassified Maridesulfovibrio]|uniref:pentapeptide repeat-containing protein n=1 Tax=unclassified Maridesulfovibrio TaxID=2794999 RepID=UPI003B422F76
MISPIKKLHKKIVFFRYDLVSRYKRIFLINLKQTFRKLISIQLFLTGLFVTLIVFGFILSKLPIPEYFVGLTSHLKEGAKQGTANYLIYHNIGLIILGLIGVCLASWRSKSLSKQTYIAEQGHITERIIKATEQLGNEQMCIRIGGIYTLWRTAEDSDKKSDKKIILDLLCAFIRNPTNDPSLNTDENPLEVGIRNDVQIATSLVTKEIYKLDLLDEYRADLSNAFLAQADLMNATLIEANLKGAILHSANLKNSDMQGVNLEMADLTYSNLNNTGLQRSNLSWAKLNEVDLKTTKLTKANLWGAFIENSKFSSTTFDNVFLTKRQCEALNIENHGLIHDKNDINFLDFPTPTQPHKQPQIPAKRSCDDADTSCPLHLHDRR